MLSGPHYREPVAVAAAELVRRAGTQFDPSAVETFVAAMAEDGWAATRAGGLDRA